MAIDLRRSGKSAVITALGEIRGLQVYGRKAARKPVPPFVLVRKVAEDNYDYMDRQRPSPAVSVLRIELRATSESEADRLGEEIEEAIANTGRLMGRDVYFEGVEPNVGGADEASALFRTTWQYRIMET